MQYGHILLAFHRDQFGDVIVSRGDGIIIPNHEMDDSDTEGLRQYSKRLFRTVVHKSIAILYHN